MTLTSQVPDKEQAGIFYGEGLGLSADPGSTAAQRGGVAVTWFNIGRQQVLLHTAGRKSVLVDAICNRSNSNIVHVAAAAALPLLPFRCKAQHTAVAAHRLQAVGMAFDQCMQPLQD